MEHLPLASDIIIGFFFNSIAVLPLILAHNIFNQPKGSHQRCSIKKLILKISQYLQENIYVGVSFW